MGGNTFLSISAGNSNHFATNNDMPERQLKRKYGIQSMSDKIPFFILNFLVSDHLNKYKNEDNGSKNSNKNKDLCVLIIVKSKFFLSLHILDIFHFGFPYKSQN